MALTIPDSGTLVLDPADIRVVRVDWGTENLGTGVEIVTSTFMQTNLSHEAWNITSAYAIDDLVLSAGTVYRCILAHTGFVPPNVLYWVSLGTDLTTDNETIVAGGRSTQLRLIPGATSTHYKIDNQIFTNEVPAQTKNIRFYVLVEDR